MKKRGGFREKADTVSRRTTSETFSAAEGSEPEFCLGVGSGGLLAAGLSPELTSKMRFRGHVHAKFPVGLLHVFLFERLYGREVPVRFRL